MAEDLVDDIEAARVSERDALLLKKSASTTEPFSLAGFRDSMEAPLRAYGQFAAANGPAIESIESLLRSLSYILPGRFKDAELVSEVLFSVLQLFRHYNDVLFGSLGRSMSLHQRALLAYFAHLKTRHPLLKTLLAVLNVIRLVQVPMEMLILKLAPTHRSIFVLALELGKFALKFGVWQGSGWRIVPKHLSVPVDRQRLAEETWKSSAPNAKNKDEPVWRLEEQMRQLELQMKQTADPAAGLHRYLKGHKHNIYTANPQLVFHPAVGWAAWTRELAHLARPSIYVLGLMVCSGGSLRNDHPNETILRTWAPLLISLALDLYSKWPDLGDGLRLRPNISVLEAEERARRLLDLLYYPLRSPVYGTITSSIIDALETKLAAWPALAPLVGIIERSALTVDSHI